MNVWSHLQKDFGKLSAMRLTITATGTGAVKMSRITWRKNLVIYHEIRRLLHLILVL